MGEITEKVYHRSGGTTTSMKMYNTLLEVGDDYLDIHIDGATAYLPLGPVSDPRASSFHFSLGGTTYHALTTGSIERPIGTIKPHKTSCPSGWTRDTAFDSLLLRGAASYGGAGDGVHSHTVTIPSGTTGAIAPPSQGIQVPEEPSGTEVGQYPGAGVTHTHTFVSQAVSSASGTVLPAYFTVVLCRRTS